METVKSAEIAEALASLCAAEARVKSAFAGVHPLDIKYGLRDGAYESVPLFQVLRESLKLSKAEEASASDMLSMLPERVRQGRRAQSLGGAIRSLSQAGVLKSANCGAWRIVREKL